jgi:hypothetical protein
VSGIGRVSALVLECPDPSTLARFWSRVLGVPVTRADSSWASLAESGLGQMSFQRVADYRPPSWPGRHGEQQMHLDVLVEDLPAATAQVIGWGATALTDVLDPGPKQWRIFADPAGHPFCLVTVPEEP